MRLTYEKGTGEITTDDSPEKIQKTNPREDVATTILEVLEHPKTSGKIIVISAGNTPIKEALLAV